MIFYDPHARKRMSERRVGEDEIAETLRNYDADLPGRHGRRNRYKVIAGRRIRVTFDTIHEHDYYVWTVTADEVPGVP